MQNGYSERHSSGASCTRGFLGGPCLLALGPAHGEEVGRRPERGLVGSAARHVRLRPLWWAQADEGMWAGAAQVSRTARRPLGISRMGPSGLCRPQRAGASTQQRFGACGELTPPPKERRIMTECGCA